MNRMTADKTLGNKQKDIHQNGCFDSGSKRLIYPCSSVVNCRLGSYNASNRKMNEIYSALCGGHGSLLRCYDLYGVGYVGRLVRNAGQWLLLCIFEGDITLSTVRSCSSVPATTPDPMTST